MHYVFTQILRYSHSVLDCASLGAAVLSLPSVQESCDCSCLKPAFRSTLLAVVMNESTHQWSSTR
ncbi:hypothetical protein T08_2449 [Trichinella sp. T8]|nr:hypothetical protein T08_2449 [Trichinella sp. T8]